MPFASFEEHKDVATGKCFLFFDDFLDNEFFQGLLGAKILIYFYRVGKMD